MDTRSEARSSPTASGPEVSFRTFRSDADYEAVARVLDACRVADGTAFLRSANQIKRGLALFIGFDPAEGLVIAEAAGEVVAFGYGLLDGDHPELGRILRHTGCVLPGWRGRGIGRRLLARVQAAARSHAARVPGLVPATTVFQTVAEEVERDARRLLEHDGYSIARYAFSMVRPTLADPPSPELPPGIECRPVDRENAMQVMHAIEEAMLDHWGIPQRSDETLRTFLDHPLLGQLDVWQVAWEGDEVVGGVLGFINEDENRIIGRARGYTENIFTRRPWRGRGIATALIGRNLRLLGERGMTEAALSVDAENPSGALALYEKVGFVRDHTSLFYHRPA